MVLVILLVSNHVPVRVGFSPFVTFSTWLGPVIIEALALGFFLGLFVAMPKQFHWRRRARIAEKRVAELSVPRASVQSGIVQPTILK